MRKLASVQTIKSLTPIEGADKIELAKVLGWNVVVQKGLYKEGDKVIYCEIDSVCPEKPEFEFLRPRGMRVRTIRLKGQVSQGICFPMSILDNKIPITYSLPLEEDTDVTEMLGIIKYEPPVPANLGGTAKGVFPSFLCKTDETRVQVLQPVLDKYKGTPCYVMEKLDGSSATYFIRDGVFGVCSRNLELIETEGNTFWKVARELDIENKLRSLGYNCALQGELIGEGIQDNKYKLKGQKVHFFSFFDIDKYEYAGYVKFLNITIALGLPIVPIISKELYALENDIEALVKMSVGKSELNKDVWREGIVIRPLEETIDHEVSNGHLHKDRVSFKAINPEFLLKYGE